MILKQYAIEKLNKELGLPYTGTEQDWDIELAEANKIDQFLLYYQNQVRCPDEKVALMAIIISSYDDLLNLENRPDQKLWNQIKSLINDDYEIFKPILTYWSVEEETEAEMFFAITPLIRELLK